MGANLFYLIPCVFTFLVTFIDYLNEINDYDVNEKFKIIGLSFIPGVNMVVSVVIIIKGIKYVFEKLRKLNTKKYTELYEIENIV